MFSSFWRKSPDEFLRWGPRSGRQKELELKEGQWYKEGPLDSVSLYRLALEVEKVSNGRNQMMKNSVCQWNIPAVPQITHMGSDEHYMVLGLTPVKGQFMSSPFPVHVNIGMQISTTTGFMSFPKTTWDWNSAYSHIMAVDSCGASALLPSQVTPSIKDEVKSLHFKTPLLQSQMY